MWYGHIRDLFPTAEGCMGSRTPNVTLLHWAQQEECYGVMSVIYVPGSTYLGAGQTSSCPVFAQEGWVDYMKRTGVIVARQLKKHGQQRVQTLAMRRVRIAAWQMVSCPNDAKGRRYWEESVTWRRTIATARSGNVFFLADRFIANAFLRVSWVTPGYRS